MCHWVLGHLAWTSINHVSLSVRPPPIITYDKTINIYLLVTFYTDTMKYPSTLTYSSCKFWAFILYQVGQCNTLYTPCDLLSVWRKKVWFIDLPPDPQSRAGTIFTAVTAGLQIFGRGRQMARVDFMPMMGVSSLAISKMDGAMGRACW